MIVIFIDNIENFLSFLDKRIMDQVFYEFREIKDETDLSKETKIEIILHYLAKIGDTLILYETKQKISKTFNSDSDLDVINSLQNIFDKTNASLKLVKGKIREIFLSYSP
ncbi:MAG: hypothetical protein KGD74_06850 [Candidatus Lokiarchaeota archaeon]|nr:hypothetical protein [Candidatus Lokiarchaeota archaeon]